MRRPVAPLLILALILGAVPPVVGAPPAATAASEDQKALQAARVRADGPGLLAYFQRRTLTAAQRKRLRELLPRLGHDSFAVRQQASLDLMALGPAALAHLRAALDDPDEEVKERLRAIVGGLQKAGGPDVGAAAARLIRTAAPAGAVDTLLAYLPDADGEDVTEEVVCTLAVLGVRDGEVTPALVEALKDPEPARRGGAAAVVGRSGTAEQRAAVRRLLHDPRPLVRLRAAQGLLAARDRTAVPALIDTLTDGTAAEAARAEELLACLAGAGSPRVVFEDTPPARRRCRAAWANWWRFNSRIDLKRADVDLPAFNATIRCQRTARRFLTAFSQGDQETVKKAVGVPFLFGGERVFTQAAELEKALDELTTQRRDLWAAFPSAHALRVRNGGARAASATEVTFLQRFRRGEVRLIDVAFPPGPGLETATVFVRLDGSQPRVVGFDPGIVPLMYLSR